MEKYYEYLSKLMDEAEIPLPTEVNRIYMYHSENGFLRNAIGIFLNRKHYRKYFIKIKINSGVTIVKRVSLNTVPLWNERVAEINSEIYHRKMNKE